MTAMFDNWMLLRGVTDATPANVAAFVREIGHIGIDEVVDQVEAIARQHYMRGLADPTLSEPVAIELNRISRIQPPHSWPKAHRLAFLFMPIDAQRWVVDSELKRRQEISRLNAEINQLRKTNDQTTTAAPAAA